LTARKPGKRRFFSFDSFSANFYFRDTVNRERTLWHLIAISMGLLVAGCSGESLQLHGTSGLVGSTGSEANSAKHALPDGSPRHPLRVMLVPADGGTEDGTRADFEPIFDAISRAYQLKFEIHVGHSYNAVIEAMANDQVDVAFFGAVSYDLARRRGVAQLLAVEERNGESVYYSGIFCRADSTFKTLTDLKGKTVAFGDIHSTSSFNYPVAMLIKAGVDPGADLSGVYLAGSHANSLQALAAGKVDAACASYVSFEKAVQAGKLDPKMIRPLAKSDPIPSPPIAMHVKLDDSVKARLKDAFRTIHQHEGIRPEMLRGYGGKQVDRYNADFSEEQFAEAIAVLQSVADNVKEGIRRKASEG